MGLKQMLSALKLVELDPPASGAAKKPVPAPSQAPPQAPPRLEQILAELPEPKAFDASALPEPSSQSGDLAIPSFADIYRAAAIEDPAHGFSAGKILEMLEAPELAALDPKAKAAALQGFLKMNPSGPVAIADVIRDAVRRDQALDKFEELLRSKLGELAARTDEENAVLQAEIDQLQQKNRARMEENRRALEAQRQRLDAWAESKRAEEARLASAVSPFVEGNPISR